MQSKSRDLSEKRTEEIPKKRTEEITCDYRLHVFLDIWEIPQIYGKFPIWRAPAALCLVRAGVRRLQHSYPNGARSFPRRFPPSSYGPASPAPLACSLRRPIGRSAELLVLVAPPAPLPSRALLHGFRWSSPHRQIPLPPLPGAVQPGLNFSQFQGTISEFSTSLHFSLIGHPWGSYL
jgi:hypothetical protein